MRRTEFPTISIVVVSSHSRAQLSACLDALIPQCERADAQLVVVRSATRTEALVLSESMRGGSLVAAPPAATPKELRALGMAEAGGDIVAFISDDRVPDDMWVASLQRRAAGPGSVGRAR